MKDAKIIRNFDGKKFREKGCYKIATVESSDYLGTEELFHIDIKFS